MKFAYVSIQPTILPVLILNITYVLLLPASKLAENGFRVTVTNYNKENVSQIAIVFLLVAVQKDSYHCYMYFFLFL